ncbi:MULTISPECIES: NCS1 family transporter [unclassified Pseudovibrio]|uniref:NCS1 family transporter n=1 Tax=Pseudovibrio TaxID=258255 RepID=UPI000186F515|nr:MULTISPECIES: NCS1 family transporter [unclassified Pseudovibrio]EEA93219.1 permease for cytosine/purine, uracil, thiamine, allantoin [Pseudovibrio sp. JE062]WNZ53924.1 NCS1 family transporter [Microbulbifer sp. MKSA007]
MAQTQVMDETSRGQSRLMEPAILPVWLNQRAISNRGYIGLWISMAVIIATFQLGAGGVAGLPLPIVIATIFFANLLLGIVMAMTADIGTEHGISFAVYLRAPFGTVGTHIPSITRGIVAAIWFGIQTYLGALALNGIFSYLTGFDNWVVWYIGFAVLQVINTAMGIRAVERLAKIAAPAIMAISVWMYFTLDGLATASGKDIWSFAGDAEISIVALFVANMAFWSSLAVDIPNITRFLKVEAGTKSFFKRNKNVFLAQFIALPVVQSWIALIGAVSFIAAGDWNPITVIQGQGTGITLVVLLVMVVLAQWSTNTSANLIPAALTFVNAGAPWITYAMGLVLAAIVGTLAMPWLILDHLFTYLGLYGAMLASLGGIMICDYFVIRKRRLNVPELYEEEGQFKYIAGCNPAGLIAWAVGGALAIYAIDLSYFVGFFTAFALYWVLMKAWILPKFKQDELVHTDDEKYLATSINRNWVYLDGQGMVKMDCSSIPAHALSREDL